MSIFWFIFAPSWHFIVAVYFFLPVARGDLCGIVVRSARGGDFIALRGKAVAAFTAKCRMKEVRVPEEIGPCSFVTVASEPHQYQFILRPLGMPFQLNFEVKTRNNAIIALAEHETVGSIFSEIVIGGYGNTKSVVRACYVHQCLNDVSEHREWGLLTESASRPFWVGYKEGIVTVGKGGQEKAFLEWDAGAYHGRVPTQVRIGIASWRESAGKWVFQQFCE